MFFSFVKAAGTSSFQYEALFNGIEEVRPEYISNCKQYGIPWQFVPKKPGFDWRYYSRLIRHIRRSDAGIVFIHSSAYIFPAWLGSLLSKKRKKVVVRETQANHLKAKMEWFWLAFALLTAGRIVFLSEAYRQEVAGRLRFFYRPGRISVIPNGLDLDFYRPGPKTANEKTIIGMQSRLVRLKDHDTLLTAFSLLVNLSNRPLLLRIAGDGDYRQSLEEKAAAWQLGNKVEFTGMLDEPHLLEFLASLNIYVHASLGETMSTAIMQAMACGLPVIASDVKGIQNMIENGVTGVLVPVQDPQALCGALAALLADEAKQQALGAAARQYAVQHFSNEAMVNAYRELFAQLLKAKA